MLEQRREHALRRTARTEQQDPFVRQSEAKVVHDVPGQSHTVGIVGANAAILEGQEIGGFGVFGALRDFVGKIERLELERHSDIDAFAARGAKPFNSRAEAIDRCEQSRIVDVLAGLARKNSMDLGRFAVGDRVTDNGIAIGHGLASSSRSLRV